MWHTLLQVVDVHRRNKLLGIRIMGGRDHPLHVFRQGDKPGIFILQLMEESAAAKVGRLKLGDRILQVRK
jgi:C-terminal processing protease CtpA/Prc